MPAQVMLVTHLLKHAVQDGCKNCGADLHLSYWAVIIRPHLSSIPVSSAVTCRQRETRCTCREVSTPRCIGIEVVAIDLGDHLLHHKRTGHDIASLLYVSMLLSLPEEWYPRYLLADGSMPYLAHIDSIEDLQECVAILTLVFLAGTSL